MASRDKKYEQFGLWTGLRIGWLMESASRRWGDREFLNFEGTRYSFRDLNRWVIAASNQLIGWGIKPDDRVVLHLSNSVELIVLQLAVWRIGAVTVPVIPIYREHELRSIIADTKPTLIASSFAFATRNPYAEVEVILANEQGFARPTTVLVGGEDVQGWLRLCPQPDKNTALSDGALPDPAPAEDCCTILFTSGTTSVPKGAMLSSRALLANSQVWRLGLGISGRDVAFSGAPLAHIAALFSAFLLPLEVGARTCILAGWNGDRAVKMINEEKATFMAGALTFLLDVLDRYEKNPDIEHKIKIFVSGGAPTPPSVVERADRLGVCAMRIYGMTETAGTLTISAEDAACALRANFDGKIAFGAEIEITDDDKKPLNFGEIGHIRVRTPQLLLRYTDPVVTAEQLDAEGWFYPGDLGSVTADGWLKVSGRTKDIINRGGEKFSSLDIEIVLMSCKEVKAASVVGLQDGRLGEVVGAFVVLKDGTSWDGSVALCAQLEALKLARQKFPAKWYVLDDLPKTASGKIQKHKLVEIAAGQPSLS